MQDSFPWHLVWNKHDEISQWPKNMLSYFSRTTLKELVALQFRLPMFWCGHVVPSNRPHAASLILIGLSLVHVTLKSYFRASFFGMSNRQLHTSCRHLCSRNVFSHDLKLIPSKSYPQQSSRLCEVMVYTRPSTFKVRLVSEQEARVVIRLADYIWMLGIFKKSHWLRRVMMMIFVGIFNAFDWLP